MLRPPPLPPVRRAGYLGMKIAAPHSATTTVKKRPGSPGKGVADGPVMLLFRIHPPTTLCHHAMVSSNLLIFLPDPLD